MTNTIDNTSDRWKLGNPEMDATHEEFINLINKLAEANSPNFVQLFEQLLDHTQTHFDKENEWMRQSNYPAINEHVAEHRRVLTDLKLFKNSVDKGRPMMARAWIKQQAPAWFDLHLSSMDAALALHLATLSKAQAT